MVSKISIVHLCLSLLSLAGHALAAPAQHPLSGPSTYYHHCSDSNCEVDTAEYTKDGYPTEWSEPLSCQCQGNYCNTNIEACDADREDLGNRARDSIRGLEILGKRLGDITNEMVCSA